jgi:multiple sugar transport system substrate-binding protein
MKKLVSVLLVISMMLLSLGTCTAFAESTKTASGKDLYHGYDLDGVTIDFWNYITGEDNVTLTKWVDKFNAENPYGIIINQDSMSGDVLTEKIPVALASGNGPQLVLGGIDVPAAADKGMILPLDDFFQYSSVQPADFIDGLLDITTYENHLYGIPFYIGVTFMFWNKDLYTKAGLDPDVGPKTWDELYADAKAVRALGDNYYGLNFAYGLTYSVYDVMACYGGHIITIDPDTHLYKNEIYSDANKEALGFWQNFYTENLNPVDASDDLFYSGIVGTIITGPWAGATARDDYGIDVGFGLAPGANAGTYYYCASMNMNITNNATTTEQKLACYAWMDYWNQIEPCIDFSTSNNTPVYLKAAISDPRITSNKDLAAMSDFEGRTAWNWVPVGFTFGTEVGDQMYSMLEALAMGNDLDTALKTCSDAVDLIIADANAKRIAEGKNK